ncbi:MAG TPA: universal stress protein [Polyangiaceae bacterium]|nr:universal stress protein [Polyangiaceae bacterium]
MSSKPFVIVVGIDYSPLAERALQAAFKQAQQHAPAEVHVTHVAPPIKEDEGAFLATGPLSLNELKDQLVTYMRSFVLKLDAASAANIRVISHVLVDTPMLGLTSLASSLEANLIVVGTHGRSGVARLLLGSVAEGVVRQAPCPVLVIPPEREALNVPNIEPPCPLCVEERQATAGRELWCQQHREHHGRRHTYHQFDRVGAETNMPLVMR